MTTPVFPSESAGRPGPQYDSRVPATLHSEAAPPLQGATAFTPGSGGSDAEYEHVSAPRGTHISSGPVTPQLSPRQPKETDSASAVQGFAYESSAPASGISHNAPSGFSGSVGAPAGGSTFVAPPKERMPAPASGISHDLSSKMAGSSSSPGGPTFETTDKGFSSNSLGQQRVAAASPSVTDVGASTGLGQSGGTRNSEAGKASIGGGGVNADTAPTANSDSNISNSQPQGYVQQASNSQPPGYVQQAKEAVAPYAAMAQETVGPYVAKAQETAGPYVAKAQETVGPLVAQAQESAIPYVVKAKELGSSAIESSRPVITQAANSATQAASSAYNNAAAGLDARGVNMETTQQKLADAGQVMKDYGAVGQQRAGQYFQQAVDQAKNMDGENKSIVATIFGTVFLVWLAFGFSLVAMLALGVASSIAALLARFSSKRVGGHAQTATPDVATSPRKIDPPGVETHYPKPSHPDNSLNNAAS